MRRFFHELSPESRRNGSSRRPNLRQLVDRLADSSDPHRALTLIVHRLRSASHSSRLRSPPTSRSPKVAEVAFAVDDRSRARASPRCCSSGSRCAPRNGFSVSGDDARRQHADARGVPRFRLRDPIETTRRRRRGAAVADAVGRRRAVRGRARPAGDGRVAAADAGAAGGRGRSAPRAIRRASAGACSTRCAPAASAARSIR